MKSTEHRAQGSGEKAQSTEHRAQSAEEEAQDTGLRAQSKRLRDEGTARPQDNLSCIIGDVLH